MTCNFDDPEVKNILLPDSLEELLVDFNRVRVRYVKVPLHAFERNKEHLINHALNRNPDLTDWHKTVRDPHAVAHIVSDGEIVYVVPPLLTRIPTLNPAHGHQTLTRVVADHDRDGSRLPIAAQNTLRARLERYRRPEYIDSDNRQMWIDLLTQLGVYEEEAKNEPGTVDGEPDDDFTFD